MSSHNYNIRKNTMTTTSNEIRDEPTAYNTFDLLKSLESKLLSRFDRVDQELLNLKDVVIKNLQEENVRLRNKVNHLESRVTSLESDVNSLEQYGRRNNVDITGIHDSIGINELEDKVIEFLSKIDDVKISTRDIRACHRLGKTKKKKQL